VLGTELVETDRLIWLNTLKLIDPIDSFLEPLAFTDDLLSKSSDVRPTNVLSAVPGIYNYTQGLINEFTSRGYEEGRDLFLFPYDWRYGVGEPNLSLLRSKIERLYEDTGLPVNVIAHSTGGLLLKKYIMDNPNDYLLNKVIFVGVPHLGAPKAVKTLVAGDGFGVPGLSHLEMKKLAANFPVVYDLLPTPKYFATKGSYASILRLSGLGANIQDLDYDETGNFLTQDHDLNQLAYNRAQELHTIQFDNFDVRQRGIDVYNFAGCDSAGTIGKITEIRQGGIGSFAAGYDIKYVPGDQTVPLESATNTPVDADKRYFALKVGHGDLLSNVDTRREMVNIFQDQANAETYEKLTHDIGRCNLKGKAIAIFSPLTIEVTDQFGRVTRQTEVDTVENAIPGVYLDVIGDHKFLWIPEDENQYALRVQGTGVGTFTLRQSVYDNDVVTYSQQFTNIPVTPSLQGVVMLGSASDPASLALDLQGDGSVDINLSPDIMTTGEISVFQPDLEPPVSSLELVGTAGQQGYFRSGVAVKLFASDEVDSKPKIMYRLGDNQEYQPYLEPFTLTIDGDYKIDYYAEDAYGNKELSRSASFVIDNSPPEISLVFDELVNDFVFAPIDNQPKSFIEQRSDIIVATDLAGNITELEFSERDRKKAAQAELEHIRYNGVEYDLNLNRFLARWQTHPKKGLISLIQKVRLAGEGSITLNYDGKNSEIITAYKKQRQVELVFGLAKLVLKTNRGILERVLLK
jgi:hypothetical protein